MKELNKFLDKLDKNSPHVYNKIDVYGKGKIIQVVIGQLKNKVFKVKDGKEPGIYKTIKDNIDIIEVLYDKASERKKYAKELIAILKEELKDRVVYISCMSADRDTLMLQLYSLSEVKKFDM